MKDFSFPFRLEIILALLAIPGALIIRKLLLESHYIQMTDILFMLKWHQCRIFVNSDYGIAEYIQKRYVLKCRRI